MYDYTFMNISMYGESVGYEICAVSEISCVLFYESMAPYCARGMHLMLSVCVSVCELVYMCVCVYVYVYV